jgi:hypothetical protein
VSVLVLATLLLRGCASADIGDRFPEPPISPAWHQGTSR